MAASAEPAAFLPRTASVVARGAEHPTDASDWPHTTRMLPWMLAAFIVVLWLVPFDAVDLAGGLPVDTKLDRVVLAPIALFWLMCLTTGAGPRLRRTPLNVAIVVFLSVSVASVLFNAETLSRLDELGLATKKLVLLFSFVTFAYIAATTIRPGEIRAFSRLIVVLASITAIGVIYEYRTDTNVFYDWTQHLLGGIATVAPEPGNPTFGRHNNTGPTAHALAVCTMLAMALPFAFTGLLRTRERRGRILYGIAITLILAGSASTDRKTGAVAPLVALLVLFAYRRAEMVRLLPLGIVLVIGVQALAPGAAVRVKAQFVNGTLTSSRSTEGRTDDYSATAPDRDSHMALGRGYGTYDPYKYRFIDNQYLKETIETGFIGVAAYIVLVLQAIAVAHGPARSGNALRAPPALAVVAAILVFGVASALFDALAFPQVPYMFGLVAAIGIVAASPAVVPESRSGARGGAPPKRMRAPAANVRVAAPESRAPRRLPSARGPAVAVLALVAAAAIAFAAGAFDGSNGPPEPEPVATTPAVVVPPAADEPAQKAPAHKHARAHHPRRRHAKRAHKRHGRDVTAPAPAPRRVVSATPSPAPRRVVATPAPSRPAPVSRPAPKRNSSPPPPPSPSQPAPSPPSGEPGRQPPTQP